MAAYFIAQYQVKDPGTTRKTTRQWLASDWQPPKVTR